MNKISKKPLFNDLNSLYTGAICHKEFLLLLNPRHSEVLVLNKCLETVGNIKTEKYKSITENRSECYFILTKVDDKNTLYKTTYDFLEFNCIHLNVPAKYKEDINDIFYDEIEKRIFVATKNYVYTVTLDGYFIKEEAHSSFYSTPSKVMRNLNGCCSSISKPVQNTFEYTAVGKCVMPYMSFVKNDKAILSTIEDDECKEEVCLGSDIKVVSIFVCQNKLYLLVIKCNKYSYLYETEIECPCHKLQLPCHNQICPGELGCNEKCCHRHKHCIDPAACILESIALEQTALSHILNAEGEKIQKAIKNNANVCELLEINESVKDTIFNTTMLEHVLHKKLEKTLEYDCHHKKC